MTQSAQIGELDKGKGEFQLWQLFPRAFLCGSALIHGLEIKSLGRPYVVFEMDYIKCVRYVIKNKSSVDLGEFYY